MNLPLHPMIVHLPLALAALMPLLAGAMLLAIGKSWLPRRAWAIVVACQLVLVVSGAFALRTGEADEDRVERTVPERALERHEEAAERFQWAGWLVLALSVLPLLSRHRARVLLAGAATGLGTAAVLGLAVVTGHAGAELVYGHGAAAVSATHGSGVAAARHHDDDDR